MLSTYDYDKERQIRNALIRRWNKYHPINREVARHMQVLHQQGEHIGGRWEPIELLNVLALCEWAIQHPDIETKRWAHDGDGGGMYLPLDRYYIEEITEWWHPKTVMDFFKYNHGRDAPFTDEPTDILDDLREATDPLHATDLLLDVLSRNLSEFLYEHFIGDKAGDPY